MEWALVVLNNKSLNLALNYRRICKDKMDVVVNIYVPSRLVTKDVRGFSCRIRELTNQLFKEYDVIIYMMSIGIIVREISQHVKSKLTDPAVICISPDGKYVIPILSGHIGGANETALNLAKSINATPVITTASDVYNKKAVDTIAKEYGLSIQNMNDAKIITSMIIDDKRVEVISKYKYDELQVKNEISDKAEGVISISIGGIDSKVPNVTLIPKKVVIGIGARRGVAYTDLNNMLELILRENNIYKQSIKCIASIDIKKDEQAIIKLSNDLKVEYITYSAKDIRCIESQFKGSDFVRSITGVGCVSMPCGYLASNKGKCLVERVAHNGMTISIWEDMT